jgi:hypothetical protein
MKIKKGKLNYDQSGRAYPPNPRVKENWDCIWEYEGKYYKLVGDNEHKEWDEVNIYNQIIDEVYENFIDKTKGLNLNLEINKDIIVVEGPIYHATPRLLSQETFINKCKTDNEFSEKWGLKIEERELNDDELNIFNLLKQTFSKLTTITYKEQTIESYE